MNDYIILAVPCLMAYVLYALVMVVTGDQEVKPKRRMPKRDRVDDISLVLHMLTDEARMRYNDSLIKPNHICLKLGSIDNIQQLYALLTEEAMAKVKKPHKRIAVKAVKAPEEVDILDELLNPPPIVNPEKKPSGRRPTRKELDDAAKEEIRNGPSKGKKMNDIITKYEITGTQYQEIRTGVIKSKTLLEQQAKVAAAQPTI